MKYRINGFLYYDVIDATLSIHDDGLSDTQLSITANALLYFLLQSEGVISRDEILKAVWDDNGLISSNGNLNQYLSLLRKTFRHYQIEDFIVTVARGRLEINKNIHVEVIDDNQLHPLFWHQQPQHHPDSIFQPIDSTSQASPAMAKSSKLDNEHQERAWQIASLVLLSCIVLMLGFVLIGNVRFFPTQEGEFFKLTRLPVASCNVYIGEDFNNPKLEHSYQERFDAMRQTLDLECLAGLSFVFYDSDKLNNKELGRIFMAQCTTNEKNSYVYCDNYFYYKGKSS